jgi:hypothetical protein
LVSDPIIGALAGQIGLRIGLQFNLNLDVAIRRRYGERLGAKAYAGSNH